MNSNIEIKKKRGGNYTKAEKEVLLELIKKYKNIIENKETNANMILKKRETWDAVCQQYNAVAVSGNRTWKQLRHLYENLKQRSKKDLALENRLQFYEKPNKNQMKASLDKKQINCTGGGGYCKSTLTDQDNQILAMVAPQIKPVCNPYDDAALYFGDIEDDVHITTNESESSSELICHADIEHKTPKAKATIKEKYFRQKLKNARLKQNHLINTMKMKKNKYKLKMEILKFQLHKLKSFRKN